MNFKRYIAASLAVYALSLALGFAIHSVILKDAYEATGSIWRPDMQSKMFLYGMAEAIVFGIAVALIYKSQRPSVSR